MDSLIEDLNNQNSTVRAFAAESLGSPNDIRAIDPLIRAFKDTDITVQFKASSALVKIGKPSVTTLIQALIHEDHIVREIAASTLGKIEDARAVDPLIYSLNDNDSYVREEAAYSLGEIRDPRAVKPLIQALKDNESFVRAGAAWALGEIGDPGTIKPLVKASQDDSCWVRGSVSRALEKLEWKYGR